jgi:hypothetical protein
MAIERDDSGYIVLRCDGPKCHEFEETHCQNFSAAMAKAKSHGWINRKVGDEWENVCRDCI